MHVFCKIKSYLCREPKHKICCQELASVLPPGALGGEQEAGGANGEAGTPSACVQMAAEAKFNITLPSHTSSKLGHLLKCLPGGEG